MKVTLLAPLVAAFYANIEYSESSSCFYCPEVKCQEPKGCTGKTK